MIAARDIQAIEYKRKTVKKETYKHILSQFDKKIRRAVNLGTSEVFLSVPSFVIGYPLYDTGHAAAYIKRQLERLGYNVTQSGTEFFLTWGKPNPVPEKVTQEPVHDEDFPTFVNLRKIANKLQKNNPGK
jgi:hypothetical protein